MQTLNKYRGDIIQFRPENKSFSTQCKGGGGGGGGEGGVGGGAGGGRKRSRKEEKIDSLHTVFLELYPELIAYPCLFYFQTIFCKVKLLYMESP